MAADSTAVATWVPSDERFFGFAGDVWDSNLDSVAAGKSAVTNKNGKRFVLFLMPTPQLFTGGQAGFDQYAGICAGAGLKMVMSGRSSYSNNCDDGKCIPLPGNGGSGTDANGQYWGSSTDVDDAIATVTGWRDFVFHHHDENRPVNHPSYTNGWTTQKRALCGIEL
jgi:hypothetical protein